MGENDTTTGVGVSVASPSDAGAGLTATPAVSPDGVGAIAGQTAADAISAATPQQPTTLDTSTAGTTGLDAIIDAIPTDDADLATQSSLPHYQSLIEQRGQLRTLRDAVRDLQPLKAYQQFGPPTAIQPMLQLANLLFSPVIDPRTNQPRRDPATQTAFVTTKPFIEFLDTNSPGMPEQLLADLLEYQPLAEDGATRADKLAKQVLAYWDSTTPDWWKSRYGVSDAQLASSTFTPEELAEIPSDYHAAYRTIPPSVRAAWKAYSEADQALILADYKGKLDSKAQLDADKIQRERDRQTAIANHAVAVAAEQAKYFDTIRRERFGALSQSLSKQVTFSTDPAAQSAAIGEMGCVLWNLIDPDGHFIADDSILKSYGVRYNRTKLDADLAKFSVAASDAVALHMAGDRARASNAEIVASDAADAVMTQLHIIALELAKKKGATLQAAAAVSAASLATAATSRAGVGAGSPNGQPATGGLPANMRPDSPEALRYIVDQTQFVRQN